MPVDVDPEACARIVRAAADKVAQHEPFEGGTNSISDLIAHARNSTAVAAREVRASLTSLFPEISWLDEEERPNKDNYWLYDAIDGAYHFVQGLPLWSSSLVLVENQRPVFALVYDPTLKEMFAAQEGGGTTCNGKSVAVSSKTAISAAVVGTAIPPIMQVGEAEQAQALDFLGTVAKAAFVVRPMAAVSLQLAYVASGRLDAYWENGHDAADWLAGSLLVEEAGGTVSHLNGRKFGWLGEGIIASNPHLHGSMGYLLQPEKTHMERSAVH